MIDGYRRNRPQKGSQAMQRTTQQRRQQWRTASLSGGLALLCLMLLVGSLFYWLVQPNSLPVRQLLVTGQHAMTPLATIQQAIASQATGHLMRVDLAAIRQKLLALPWINTVQVVRQWPDVLQITVTEHNAVARWQDQLVAHDGTLFKPTDLPMSLPELIGPAAALGRLLKYYQQFSVQLQAIGYHLQTLGADARDDWYAILDNGIHLALGRQQVAENMQRFIRFHALLLADISQIRQETTRTVPQQPIMPQPSLAAAAPVHIDLRYQSGVAVRLAGIK